MANYTVKYGQNLFDIALQVYGDVSGLGDLLAENKKINLGYEPQIGDIISYNPDNAVNPTIVKYFSDNGIVVSNGIGHVYFKETSEDLKMMVFIDKNSMTIDWKIAGSGSLTIDWGDDSDLEVIDLDDTPQRKVHNMNSFLSEVDLYRKIRFYGDFELDHFEDNGAHILKIFAIDNFELKNINISGNTEMDNIGFLDIAQEALSIDIGKIKANSLLPLISQEKMRDLWINDALLTQQVLDDYFIGLVKNYQARPECNVRMWGNNSPSGIYQRPEALFDPQTGLEAMWVLENERGWTIQEIIVPPLESTINRRFRKRDGMILVDEIDGVNGEICLPVSKFVSADSSEVTTNINATTINQIDFKIMLEALPSSEGTIVGAQDNVHGTHFKINLRTDGKLYFSHGPSNFTAPVSLLDNKVHTVNIDARDGGGMMCYIDGELITQLAAPTESTDALVAVGCLRDSDGVKSDFLDALIWDMRMEGGQYNMPLPHLGYDTILKVKHVVTKVIEKMLCPEVGGVKNDGGSQYMQLHGAVARTPNLLLNGFAEKIGDGSSYGYWNETKIDNSLANKRVVLSALLKVDQDAADNGVKSRILIFKTDNGGTIVGGNLGSIETNDVSYGRFSLEVLIPSDAEGFRVIAYHSPSSSSSGNVYSKEISVVEVEPEYIPNTPDGESLLPLLSGDRFIPGSSFLNQTPFEVIFDGGGIELKEYLWDKSRGDIWDNAVRALDCYDPSETKKWCMTELRQRFIVDHINSSFLYIPWVKIDGGVYKDIFQYPTALLSGDDKERCNRYVHLYT